MARIRYIKPEFFDSEKVASVSFVARLLFAGLWTVADRDGRFEWSARRLKAKLFPYDTIDLEPILAELTAAGMVVRYDVGGTSYGHMPGFSRHQRPHPHEAKSTLPEPPLQSEPLHVTASNDGSVQPSVSTGTGIGMGTGTGTPADAGRALALAKPKPYAHALIPRRNLSAFWEGPIFDIPDGWARRVLKASNGKATEADVTSFAKALTLALQRSGGEAPSQGFLQWLDTEWAAYRQPAVSDGYRPASEWVEANRRASEGSCSPEEAHAILEAARKRRPVAS